MSSDANSNTKAEKSADTSASSAKGEKSTDTSASSEKGEKSTDKSASSTTSESSSSSGSGGNTGKSSRESIGGAAAVHYGYFSNIKTPEYKSGWDDIWGKKTKSSRISGEKLRPGTGARTVVKPKEPIVVSLSLEDLPEEVRLALVDAVSARLKKSRLRYDSREKAGAVSWQIECEVRR